MNTSLRWRQLAAYAAGLYAVVLVAVSMGLLEPVLLRAMLVLPNVLFAPGFALTLALAPHTTLDWVERLALGVGLSLAIGALGGLVLNLLPWGVRPITWLLYYTCLLGVCLGTTAVRRRSYRRQVWCIPSLTLGDYAIGSICVLAMTAAAVVSISGLQQTPAPTFTQLWMVAIDTNNPPTTEIGITNVESRVVTYRLVLRDDGVAVQEWPAITLAPGQMWKHLFQAPAGDVEVIAYRSDAPDTPYRRVSLRAHQ